ncbi:unnamed protein product [Gongylonema pulchrum]|uniref:Ty3-gypsy retrotransposon protein n=1 Tax=Gongylonema pulchrum TaxID=637853 RepID=A0A183ES02_9BILA|nr:unnamed protein product [Gongylonema pulchrum]
MAIHTSNRRWVLTQDMEALANRVKQFEEEVLKIRKIQTDVERQMNISTSTNASQGSGGAAGGVSIEDKIEADSRSIYVGNQLIRNASEMLHLDSCTKL